MPENDAMHRPRRPTMHDGDGTLCGSCGPEPRWQQVADELEEQQDADEAAETRRDG